MARRKASDEQAGDQGAGVKRVQADRGSTAIGNISIGRDLSGSFTIGYTAEQVSLLLSQITTKFQPKPFSGECPYKGLEVFEEEDAGLFFGRERLVDELVGRVKESRAVFITGPSGSGKSSLVRAGLIYALKEGAIGNSKRWLFETMKPGREPLKDLALAFSRLKSPELADYFQAHTNETDILNKCAESVLSGRKDQRFVLFVDQFEEVFTQVNQETERQAFLNMLSHAGTVENGRVIVLFAMRSDFVSNCAAYPAVNELLSGQFRQIGAMQPEELVAAIALPAKKVGLPVETELIAQIINDMKGEPGALPLMQFALKELFEARQAKGGDIALTLEDYLARGGIQKMLARHADATLNGLSTEQQNLARSVFGGLIEIGRGRQDTRRTALFEELVPADTKAEDVEAVVQKLADARLVITDEQAGKDTVTIAHERLIAAWPWLEKLIDDNRDAIALQNEIANDAKEWDDHGRDPSYLYTGARLANAREKLEARKLVLSELAQTFIEAGMRAHTDELAAAAGRIQRFRILTFGLLLALVAAGFLGFVAQQQASEARLQASIANKNAAIASTNESLAILSRDEAEASQNKAQEQTTIARAGELAAQSILTRAKEPIISYLLGVEAYRLFDNVRTRSVLIDNITAKPQINQYLTGNNNPVSSVAFSPDGKRLASLSGSGSNSMVVLWDMATHQPVGQLIYANVSSIALSTDGKILAIGEIGDIVLLNADSQQAIGQPLKETPSDLGVISSVTSMVFSPDGNTLATGNADGTITLWNIHTQISTGRLLQKDYGPVQSMAFSPDGKILVSGDSGNGTIILWDMNTHRPIGQSLRQKDFRNVSSIAFTPDGKTFASALDDTIIFWDLKTRQPTGQPISGFCLYVSSLSFSPDGKTLASACSDATTITLWDIKTHQPVDQPFAGHGGQVNSVAFSPDGKTLASGGSDGNVVLWKVEKQWPMSELLQGFGTLVAFSRDGKTLALGGGDTVSLWDVVTHRSRGQFLQDRNISAFRTLKSLALSPDGKLFASGYEDLGSGDNNTLVLWNVEKNQRENLPLKQVPNPDVTSIQSLAFSPDGTILASGSTDNITLWDVNTHGVIGQLSEKTSQQVSSIIFSPDGKTLASASGMIILWDLKTHQRIGQLFQEKEILPISLAFSPDGNILVSGNNNGTMVLWDMATYRPIGLPLKAGGLVTSVDISSDGKILASVNSKAITLWDIETHQQIGAPWNFKDFGPSSIAFSPKSNVLAVADFLMPFLLNLDPQSWGKETCQRVGRNFTRAEWATYLTDKPYPTKQEDATCPQWPLEPEARPIASPTP